MKNVFMNYLVKNNKLNVKKKRLKKSYCVNWFSKSKNFLITKDMIKIPIVSKIIDFLKVIKPPGFNGFSFYDLLEMYVIGIVKGTLSSRAGSISFSFFMALFPFLLFVLNLIPFIDSIIPIQNFDEILDKFCMQALLLVLKMKSCISPSESLVITNSIFP